MGKGNTKVVVVFVTCPNLAAAKRIAEALVRRRLAACVSVCPGLSSVFWWQGRVDRARETLLVIKTTAPSFGRLSRAVCEVHPYDVPEILAVPVAAGHRPYLRWVRSSVSRGSA